MGIFWFYYARKNDIGYTRYQHRKWSINGKKKRDNDLEMEDLFSTMYKIM